MPISLNDSRLAGNFVKPSNKTFPAQTKTFPTRVDSFRSAPSPGSNNFFNSIMPPQRTSMLDSAKQFQSSGLIPQFKPLQGFDNSFYDNLFTDAETRLRKQYFDNPNSILAQRENQIKRRGLFGSGIGEQATNQVFKGFGEELAGVSRDISRHRAEQGLDIAKFNRQNEFDLSQLLLGAAGDEARAATQFDTGIFESLIKGEQSEDDTTAKLLDILAGTLSEELIDKESRNIFKSALGQKAGEFLGYDLTGFLP